jgi:hypothetical protein
MEVAICRAGIDLEAKSAWAREASLGGVCYSVDANIDAGESRMRQP